MDDYQPESAAFAATTQAAASDDPLADYTPAIQRRQRFDGWTADRQRTFLSALAETGSISQACHIAGITARSAYRLRVHPDGAAFAAAWDQALRSATGKLLTLAYERAVNGAYKEHWQGGKLVAESRQPSDKLLMFLLGNLLPWSSTPGQTRWGKLEAMSGDARAQFNGRLGHVADSRVDADPVSPADYHPVPPAHAYDPLIAPGDSFA